MKIRVTDALAIDEDEVAFEFVRASGPGGQNVNKLATAAQLRFDAAHSPSLPEDVRMRLLALAGRRASRGGVIVIEARRYRAQERNRADAITRLVELIRRAAERPKPRKKTRIGAAARRRRVEGKRRQGERKRLRRPPAED